MAFEPSRLLNSIRSRLRQLNWAAILASVALEGIFIAMLISLNVVSFTEPVPPQLTVIDIRTPSEQPPAASPAPPEKPKDVQKPIPSPQPKTQVIAPPPKIQLQTAASPMPVAVAPLPPAPETPSQNAPSAAAPAAGSGPVSVSNLNTNLLRGAPPAYPVGSRHKREQGTVVLRLVISEDGKVTDVSIHKSSGFSALDEAAVAAVRKWRWSPTIRDGRRVQITGLVQLPFILKNS